MSNTFQFALKLTTTPIAIAVALLSAPSFAQTAAPASEEADAIVVTGSRIASPDLSSSVPVAVVSAENSTARAVPVPRKRRMPCRQFITK